MRYIFRGMFIGRRVNTSLKRRKMRRGFGIGVLLALVLIGVLLVGGMVWFLGATGATILVCAAVPTESPRQDAANREVAHQAMRRAGKR